MNSEDRYDREPNGESGIPSAAPNDKFSTASDSTSLPNDQTSATNDTALEPGETTSAPSPRDPVIAIGYALQTLSMFFMGGACCLGFFSNHLLPGFSQASGDILSGEHLAASALAISTLTTAIVGMGLLGVGIGLQGEHPGSGRMGVMVTAVVGLVYGVATIILAYETGASGGTFMTGILTLIMFVLLTLCAHAARLLKAYPPPADRSVVTDEFIREYKDERRRRHNPDGS